MSSSTWTLVVNIWWRLSISIDLDFSNHLKVHSKMLFQLNIVPNLYATLSSAEHRRQYFECEVLKGLDYGTKRRWGGKKKYVNALHSKLTIWQSFGFAHKTFVMEILWGGRKNYISVLLQVNAKFLRKNAILLWENYNFFLPFHVFNMTMSL